MYLFWIRKKYLNKNNVIEKNIYLGLNVICLKKMLTYFLFEKIGIQNYIAFYEC